MRNNLFITRTSHFLNGQVAIELQLVHFPLRIDKHTSQDGVRYGWECRSRNRTSGLATGAKRVTCTGSVFERVYIDSYVKFWLMSHELFSRLPVVGETHFPTWNRAAASPPGCAKRAGYPQRPALVAELEYSEDVVVLWATMFVIKFLCYKLHNCPTKIINVLLLLGRSLINIIQLHRST